MRFSSIVGFILAAMLFASCLGVSSETSDSPPATAKTATEFDATSTVSDSAPAPPTAASTATRALTPPNPSKATASPATSTTPTASSAQDGSELLIAPTPPPRPALSGEQSLTLVGSAFGPTTLDPALIRDAESAFIARQVFRGLVTLDDALDPQPDLAREVEISADRLRYTFRLRPNATFHDGTPIDADAVVASLNRAADPRLANGDGTALPAYLYFSDIDGAIERMRGESDVIRGIVAADAITVVITLKRPSVTFLSMMTGSCALIVDTSTTTTDDWWVEPNGSGPFILEELETSHILLTAFEDFRDAPPLLDEVRILLGSAASLPLNLYEAGDIDVLEAPYYSLDRLLSPTDALYTELSVTPQLTSTFLVMNPNRQPFDDIRVRLAIAHAIDRETFVRVGMDGRVEPASGLVPPGILGREWHSEPLPYDLGKSAELFEVAGALDIRPTFYGSLATMIKGAIERDLGLPIDVIVPEWPLFSERLTDQTLPAYILSWIADYPDPANFLTAMFHSASPDNYIGYANAEVDAMLDSAASEQDENERARLYLDAQQLLIDDGVLVPLYHDVSYMLVKPFVRGLTISPVGLGRLDTVWIER